jgi:hypothetical protein
MFEAWPSVVSYSEKTEDLEFYKPTWKWLCGISGLKKVSGESARHRFLV